MQLKFLRRFGLGDLQHVRLQLLGVAYLGTQHAAKVAEEAFEAGTRLGMMTRLHINTALLPSASARAVFDIFMRNQHHQLERWDDSASLRMALLSCDIIAQDDTCHPRVIETSADTAQSLMGAWKGRPLAGNFGLLGRERLRKSHPGMIAELE